MSNFSYFVIIFITFFSTIGIASNQKQSLVIGFCLDSFQEARYQLDKKYFIEKAKENGIKVIFKSAQGSHKKQISIIRGFLKQGVNVVVVQLVAPDKSNDILNVTQKKRIPIIAYDRIFNGADGSVTHDSRQVGQLQVNGLKTFNPNIKHGIICAGPTNNPVAQEITRANQNALFSIGIQATIFYSTSWAAEDCQISLLKADKEENVDFVIANNSSMSSGAAEIIQAQKKNKQIFISGADLNHESCGYLQKGIIQQEIFKPIKPLAVAAVEMAIQLAQDLQPNKKTKRIPCILLNKDKLLQILNHKDDMLYEEIHWLCGN